MNTTQKSKNKNWLLGVASFAILSVLCFASAHATEVDTPTLMMIGIEVQPTEVKTPTLTMTGIGFGQQKMIQVEDKDKEKEPKQRWPGFVPIDRKPPKLKPELETEKDKPEIKRPIPLRRIPALPRKQTEKR